MKNYPSYRLDVVTEVIVSIGDKSAIPGLIEVLKLEYDAHWSAIATLIKALGRLKAKEAVDVIVKRGLKNQFLQVRESAAQALKEIGDPKAIPALQKAIETADEDLKRVKNSISEAIRELEELEKKN